MNTLGYINGQACAMHVTIERAVERYPSLLDRNRLRTFFQEHCAPGLLISFGDLSVDLSNTDRVVQAFTKNIGKVTGSHYLGGLPLDRDSGGFQLQTGAISKALIPRLLHAHTQLTLQHAAQVTGTFTLDVVPTANCRFDFGEELLAINQQCMEEFVRLPLKCRKTVVAVHHFKTPGLHKLFLRVLFDSDAASHFFAFATGGIAAKDAAFPTPCFPYVIPLVDVLHHIKIKNRQNRQFRFHILGKGDFQDDIAQCLFAKLIKDIHGIDIVFTWDTVGFWNGVSFSQLVEYPDPAHRSIQNLSFRYDDIHSPIGGITATEKEFYRLANSLIGRDDIGRHNAPLYKDDKPSPMLNLVAFMMHCAAHSHSVEWCREETDDLYRIWKRKKDALFRQKLSALIGRFPVGQSDRGVRKRVAQVAYSMNMLLQASPAMAAQIVHKCLKKAEFPEFQGF